MTTRFKVILGALFAFTLFANPALSSAQDDAVSLTDLLIQTAETSGVFPLHHVPRPEKVSQNDVANGRKFPIFSSPLTNNVTLLYQAGSSKKNWQNKKRPKNGTGRGTYLSGGLGYRGTWTDYRLDGPFEILWKDIVVFEGEARDGRILSGTAYALIFNRPLYSGNETPEENDTRIKAGTGTFAIPYYMGSLERVSKSDKTGNATYRKSRGIEYIPDGFSPRIEWVRVAHRNAAGQLDGTARIYLVRGLGPDSPAPLPVYEMTYANGIVGGTYYSNNLARGYPYDYALEIPFRDGKPAGGSFNVRYETGAELTNVPWKHLDMWESDLSKYPFPYSFSYVPDEVLKSRAQTAREKAAAEKQARKIEQKAALPPIEEGWAAYEAEDWKRAYDILLPHAMNGHSGAMVDIGSMYEFGYHVPQSYVRASEWYNFARKAGNPQGEFLYGYMIYSGYVWQNAGSYKHRDIGWEHMENAADQGNQAAKTFLAEMSEINRREFEASRRHDGVGSGSGTCLYNVNGYLYESTC